MGARQRLHSCRLKLGRKAGVPCSSSPATGPSLRKRVERLSTTLGQTGEKALGRAPGRDLHELQVLNACDTDSEEMKQSIGIPADIEEDLRDAARLQDLLQRVAAFISGGEGIFLERRHVD